MRTVLDTSVLIATDVDELPGELAISAISVAELQFGILVARTATVRAERLKRLSVIQRRFDPLPVDERVAGAYAELAAAAAATGRDPRGRAFDLLIAATARVHSARLATRNADDLVGVTDLVEIVPC